jgi:hypothetical protein
MSKILVNDSFEDYLGAKEYLSSSDISQLLQSQKHFQAYKNGDVKFEETASQKLGTAVHLAILEPHKFEDQYCYYDKSMLPYPDSTMVKKENKQWYEDFCKEKSDKIILTKDEYDKVIAMQQSVYSNSFAKDLLVDCLIEHSSYGVVNHDGQDIPVRVRPDAISIKGNYFISLKTTIDASKDGFANECAKYNYHAKESFYMTCLRSLLDENHKPLTGYFIAVENKAPYLCQVFDMNEERVYSEVSEFFQVGKHLVDIAFSRFLDLKETGKAKGYELESNSEIVPLVLPRYAVYSANQKLK